jgi:hypothetical protein
LEINLKKLQLLIPWDLEDYNIQTLKSFFWVFFIMNFFTPKLMKIRWFSLLFWVFCTSLPNHVEHTWFKSQLHICNYEWARIHFVDEGVDLKLQHCRPCKISCKKLKTLHLDCNGHIEGDIMQNHEQKEKWKKIKNQDFVGKTNFFLSSLPFNLRAISATWLHVGAPQKIQEKWA